LAENLGIPYLEISKIIEEALVSVIIMLNSRKEN
jgi:hypothetical protein